MVDRRELTGRIGRVLAILTARRASTRPRPSPGRRRASIAWPTWPRGSATSRAAWSRRSAGRTTTSGRTCRERRRPARRAIRAPAGAPPDRHPETSSAIWDTIQLARHQDRPYPLDYVARLWPEFEELHGDRLYGDDPAIVAGFGRGADGPVAIIGHQKGRDTAERTYRNFGMPGPEGYRKAMRVMAIADKLDIPVITLIDTPGAFPGAGGGGARPGRRHRPQHADHLPAPRAVDRGGHRRGLVGRRAGAGRRRPRDDARELDLLGHLAGGRGGHPLARRGQVARGRRRVPADRGELLPLGHRRRRGARAHRGSRTATTTRRRACSGTTWPGRCATCARCRRRSAGGCAATATGGSGRSARWWSAIPRRWPPGGPTPPPTGAPRRPRSGPGPPLSVGRAPADYLRAILTARVYDVARETELSYAPQLSARTGCTVLLKREDSQPAFSFKVRGAYNRMSALGADELARGVIAASAGNHAQGVALSAARLGCDAVIVMPVTTPRVKVDAVARRWGRARWC